jgi:hypothetical protein
MKGPGATGSGTVSLMPQTVGAVEVWTGVIKKPVTHAQPSR